MIGLLLHIPVKVVIVGLTNDVGRVDRSWEGIHRILHTLARRSIIHGDK